MKIVFNEIKSLLNQSKIHFCAYILFFLSLNTSLKAQKYNAVFKNGSEMPYEIAVNDPDKIHKYWVGIPGQTEGFRVNLIEARMFYSSRMQFKGVLGITAEGAGGIAGNISANYFFISNTHENHKETKIRLYADNSSGAKYYVKHILNVKKSIGVKGGIDYFSTPQFGYPALFVGLNTNALKFVRFVIFNHNQPILLQGTRSISFHADVFYYPLNSSHRDAVTNLPINDSSVGGRVYLEGYVGFWRKKAWGLCYSAGLGTSVLNGYTRITGITGIGIYGAFGKR